MLKKTCRKQKHRPPVVSILTSGHDMAHVLHRQSRVLVLGVDTDHSMTQSSHRQDGSGRKRSTWDTRPIYIDTHSAQRRLSETLPNSGTNVDLCIYLRIATVRASGEEAQGQITSGFRPWVWNTFRKASHEDTDPKTHTHIYRHGLDMVNMVEKFLMKLTKMTSFLTGISTVSYNEHAQGG